MSPSKQKEKSDMKSHFYKVQSILSSGSSLAWSFPPRSTLNVTCATSAPEPQAEDPGQFLYVRQSLSRLLWDIGKRQITEIERADLEGFIEHEQTGDYVSPPCVRG